jgi:alpha-1,6-mannosyltransferase
MTGADVEKGYDRRLVVQRGMLVGMLKEKVRSLTGGWWVGPRMEPRVHILKRVKGER